MPLSHLGVTKLSDIPSIKRLLVKAALKRSSYDLKNSLEVSLPSNNFYFSGIELDETNYKIYHEVTGWKLDSEFVHPCYLHCLAFPLHIMLLLLPAFPFPLLGLVHVSNQIRQIRPIRMWERLSVSSRFGQLELHPKGWLFSIKVFLFPRRNKNINFIIFNFFLYNLINNKKEKKIFLIFRLYKK